MSHTVEQSIKLAELNKKILEIKKKIQLSEGQRKALFEDCEAERKTSSDEILKLKKEVSNLVLVLHESKSPTVKFRLKNKRIEDIIAMKPCFPTHNILAFCGPDMSLLLGPLGGKSVTEVKELLDLQIIDKGKKKDLLKYKMKKRRKYMDELGLEYQKLLSKKEKKELMLKVEKPVKKSICELQNSIHAIEVQIREAIHIKNRYMDIRKSLKDDASKFESTIKTLEEELSAQNVDIEKLQKIMEEATKRKGRARANLLREERAASIAAQQREKEASEGRKLVHDRKIELEKLEKRLFMGGKLPVRTEPEGAEGEGEEEKPSTPPHPVESRAQEFEMLKRATGGTSTTEVLEKFQAQKNTQERLDALKKKSEEEKSRLEKNVETLKNKLEGYKYSEVKEAERKTSEMDRMQAEIINQQNRSQKFKEEKISKDNALVRVLESLHSLRLCVNPLSLPESDPQRVISSLIQDVKTVMEKFGRIIHEEEAEKEEIDVKGEHESDEERDREKQIEVIEERLPAPYSGLVRRTPMTQISGSPAPPPTPVSEEEEDVPSRSYLKRQAQLVVDAKSRRKNIRMQLPKR